MNDWLEMMQSEDAEYIYNELQPVDQLCIKLLLKEDSEAEGNRYKNHRSRIASYIKEYLASKNLRKANTAKNIKQEELRQFFSLYLGDLGRDSIHKIIKESKNKAFSDLKANIEKLLRRGDNINEQDEDECTPLFIAVETKRTELVDFLLKQSRIDINLSNKYGWTPLHKAASVGCAEVVRRLLIDERTDCKRETIFKATPIYEAAFGCCDNPRIIEMLEENGVDPRQESFDGFTPLMVAIWRENYSIAHFLIDRASQYDDCADYINRKNIQGESALYIAIDQGDRFPLAQKLLRQGAMYEDIFPTSTPKGDSPGANLIEAAKKGNYKAVKDIINANIDNKDSIINYCEEPYKRSALSFAAEKGYYDIVRFLVDKGANVFSRNNHARTPKDMALERFQEIKEYLSDQEQKARKASLSDE